MTLVEVAIVLSIAGVLLAIGLMRSTTLSRQYQLAIATEQVAADLQRARLEAVRRNMSITFQRTSVTQYQIAGVLTRTIAGGAYFDSLAPASVQFSSRGRLVGTPSSFQLRSGVHTKTVSIAAGGALEIQ
jgi:type II secretory pathway pseudopilin PulG